MTNPPVETTDHVSTEEMASLRATMRDFAEQEVAPRVIEYNEAGELPWDLLEQMGQLGFMGGTIPTEYGGLGLKYTQLVELVEELSRIDHVLAILMAQPSCSVGASIMLNGTEEQKRRFLPRLASGELFAAAAFTEPQSGTDFASLDTRYVERNGEFLLSGTKVFITLCDNADVFLTFAREGPASAKGPISAFLVERGGDGLSSKAISGMMGLDSIESGYLYFDDFAVPEENVLGNLGDGMRVAMSALDRGRLAVAARCVGMAQYCLERSSSYSNERMVRGHPIGDFQLIQAKLAEMAVGVDTSRMLVWLLASCIDRGMERLTYHSSMAKLHASETAWVAANHAIQVHGGYGYCTEFQVERYARDARAYLIGEGTNELQQVLIGEILLGKRKSSRVTDREFYEFMDSARCVTSGDRPSTLE